MLQTVKVIWRAVIFTASFALVSCTSSSNSADSSLSDLDLTGRGTKPEHRFYFLRWEVVDSKGSTWPPATDQHVYKLAL
jgi:hypothetical protein